MTDAPFRLYLADTIALLHARLDAQVGDTPYIVRPPRPPQLQPTQATASRPAHEANVPTGSVGGSAVAVPDGLPTDLDGLAAVVSQCRKCRADGDAHQAVFGAGRPRPVVMFVGDEPGASDDGTGRPFAGEAGALLDKIIKAMQLEPEDCYAATVVKCPATEGTQPAPDQAALCRPFLVAQIALVQPRFIVAMGPAASAALTGRPDGVARLRGRPWRWGDIPLVVTYHPAAMLRQPELKGLAWKDLQQVMARLQG